MTADLLLPAPIVLHLLAAVVAATIRRRVARTVSFPGMVLVVCAAVMIFIRVQADGIQVTQIGGWPAPFGITLVADLLSASMLVVSSLIGVAVIAFPRAAAPEGSGRRTGYYALIHVLAAAVNGALLTGDIFNLYVWFELMLMASFVLIVLGNTRSQLEGALKYAVLSIVGSVFFLGGIGLLYSLTGTLNMADVGRMAADTPYPGRMAVVSVFFLLAFGLKAAAFPLYFWLPASYPVAPVPIGALFAGLLTKVGIYALLRVFTLIFIQAPDFTHTVLLWMGCLTMVVGVLGAVVERRIQRAITFLMVTTTGFMLAGLGLFTPLGVTGAVFYLIEDAFVVTALFLFSGLVKHTFGTDRLDRLGGLASRSGLLAAVFAVPALSLAGFPPMAGFWSKYLLARAGVEASAYAFVAVLLVSALFVLVTMLRVWFGPFQVRPEDVERPSVPRALRGEERIAAIEQRATGTNPAESPRGGSRPGFAALWPVLLLVGATVVITIFAGSFVALASQAADDLLHPERYVEAVLAPEPRP